MSNTETGRTPQLRDHRTEWGRQLGDALHLPHPDYPMRRRKIATLIARTVLPHEMQGSYKDAFARAGELREEGFGGIAYFPHPDKSGPVHAWTVLMMEGNTDEVAINFPIAKHQELPGLLGAIGLVGVQADLVTTRNTLKRLIAKKKAGEEVHIPTREETAREHEIYLARSAETLGMGGIVFLAPSGEREVPQGRFRYSPMSQLVHAALKEGHDKIYFLPMGIGEKGLVEYRISGMRWFKTAEVRIDECLTLQEVDTEVANKTASGIQATRDTVLYDHLLNVLPEGMRPTPQPSA